MKNVSEESDTPNDPVQIDIYGIKAKFRPSGPDEPPPSNMTEVWERIRGHLLRLAVAPTRLVADLFDGVIRLVRGISNLPTAINSRISKAYELADRREGNHQQAVETPVPIAASVSESTMIALPDRRQELLDRLEALLADQRKKGNDGALVPLNDDVILVVIGTNEAVRGEIEAAATQALAATQAVGQLLPGAGATPST